MTACPPTLVIAGPTASGKSDLAVRIAEIFGGEIVGADAFQIYRGLPVLTAQPGPEELTRVPHHLVGEIDPSESFDVTRYLALARERISHIRAKGKPVILVGGSGMYIRAVLRGFSEGLPPPNPNLRRDLEQEPLEELVRRLVSLDPHAQQMLDLRNPRRVIRALEVTLLTGKPFTSFQNRTPAVDSSIHGLWIQVPRAELQRRIEERTRFSFKKGMIGEVEQVGPLAGLTASQAIGVREVRALLAGELSEEQVLQKIIESTRQYARRQETWFRKETYLRGTPKPVAFHTAVEMVRGAGFEPATSCV